MWRCGVVVESSRRRLDLSGRCLAPVASSGVALTCLVCKLRLHFPTYLHCGETDGQIAMRYIRCKSTELAGGTLLHSTMALFVKDAREKTATGIEELLLLPFSESRHAPGSSDDDG